MGRRSSEHEKYKLTIILLFLNALFWMRILGEYLYRFISQETDPVYFVVSVLLFLDMSAYGILAFGLWRNLKPLKIFLVPFLVFNAVLSITDQLGPWDVASLLMNVSTALVYLSERKPGE